MTAAIISGDVRRFLLANIPSAPHLEALLLLRARSDDWPLEQLAGRLYVDAANAQLLLDDLLRSGLVMATPAGFRYAPADADVAGTVDALAALYARQMVGVAELATIACSSISPPRSCSRRSTAHCSPTTVRARRKRPSTISCVWRPTA